MNKVALVDADGRLRGGEYVPSNTTAAAAGLNPEGHLEVAIDGDWPPHWMRYSAGAWIEDRAARAEAIDDGFTVDRGPFAIPLAHVQKAIEAQLILTGIDLPHSLVAAEAAAIGATPISLATAIVAKLSAAHQAEVGRRSAKLHA